MSSDLLVTRVATSYGDARAAWWAVRSPQVVAEMIVARSAFLCRRRRRRRRRRHESRSLKIAREKCL